MAKSPRAPAGAETETQAQNGEQTQPPETVAITYLAGEHDPVSIKWRRRTFHANVPVPISDPDLIEAARGNKHFKVGEFDADKDRAPAPDFTGTPKTADEYRAHVVGWVKKLQVANRDGNPNVAGIDDMITRWQSEQELRALCDVGSDDYAWIGTLFLPKMHELAKVAGLNDQQLADKWREKGVLQLPF